MISGIGPDSARFAALVGGEENLRALVHQSAFECEDLVELAERVRRDLHAAALERERVADTTRAAAVARRCDDPTPEQALRVIAKSLGFKTNPRKNPTKDLRNTSGHPLVHGRLYHSPSRWGAAQRFQKTPHREDFPDGSWFIPNSLIANPRRRKAR